MYLLNLRQRSRLLTSQGSKNAKKQFGDEQFELKNILKNWVRSKNPDMHFIPTDTLYVTIDKEAVKAA